MPGALHYTTDHDAPGQRASPVGAAVIEGDVAAFRPPEHDAAPIQMNQLHLIDLELVCPGYHNVLPRFRLDSFFIPFARAGVAVIDPDLISIDQHATHPSSCGQEDDPDSL